MFHGRGTTATAGTSRRRRSPRCGAGVAFCTTATARFERTRPRVRAVEGRVRRGKRRLRPHAFGGGRRRELRRPVRRRVARRRSRTGRRSAKAASALGHPVENATDASWTWHRTTCVESGGVTRFNETWYVPVAESSANATSATGGADEPCRSSNDVSAQAMAPVDAQRARAPWRRPNRAGSGGARVRRDVARVLKNEGRATAADARERLSLFSRRFSSGGWAATAAALAWATRLVAPRAPGRERLQARAAPAR